jgi:hypothetical protein
MQEQTSTVTMRLRSLLVNAGADIKALDHEHHGTPESWARVAIEVTNNLKCAEVAAYLSELGSRGQKCVSMLRGDSV